MKESAQTDTSATICVCVLLSQIFDISLRSLTS